MIVLELDRNAGGLSIGTAVLDTESVGGDMAVCLGSSVTAGTSGTGLIACLFRCNTSPLVSTRYDLSESFCRHVPTSQDLPLWSGDMHTSWPMSRSGNTLAFLS